jgi:hypothetical protein
MHWNPMDYGVGGERAGVCMASPECRVPRMSTTLEVPDEIQRALRVPEPER